VIGLFSGRGYNIESLTVSETEHQAHLSLITVVTTGTPMGVGRLVAGDLVEIEIEGIGTLANPVHLGS